MSSARQRELVKQNRLLVRQEALAERDVAKVIRTIASKIAASYSYGAEEQALQIVADHQNQIAAVLEKRLLQTALIFGGRALDRIQDRAKGYSAGLETKGAREIFEAAIRSWVKLHALSRAITITGTIKEAVRGVLQSALGDGLGEAGTVKLIRETIGRRLSATNAARIARTEMHTASTIGADEAARSTGLDMIKEWASAEDGRVRPSHAAADGQEVALDDAFTVGGTSLMVPGDPSGPAGEIINCRCAVLHHPIIGGEVIR